MWDGELGLCESFSIAILATQRSCSALQHCKSLVIQNRLLLVALILPSYIQELLFRTTLQAQLGRAQPQ